MSEAHMQGDAVRPPVSEVQGLLEIEDTHRS